MVSHPIRNNQGPTLGHRNDKMIDRIKSLLLKISRPSFKLVRNILLLAAILSIVFAGYTISTSNNISISDSSEVYESNDNPFPSMSFALVGVIPTVSLDSCTSTTASGRAKCSIIMQMNRGRKIYVPNMRSVGSGAVVGHGEDRTFILTAKHVCEGALPEYDVQIDELEGDTLALGIRANSEYQLTDVDGNVYEAEMFRVHQTADICVLQTSGNWGVPIRVADSHPPEGTMIYNIAAPLGIFTPGMVPRWRGYYSGRTPDGLEFYSIPVAGGSSGSPVLYNDEIISIVVMSPIGFQNVAIGVNLEDLHDVIGSIQDL